MKVNLNLNQEVQNKNNNVNFKGYKPVKSNEGYTEYEFSFPFDDNKYDCYLELYNVKQDPKTEYLNIKNIMKSPDYIRKVMNDENFDGEKGVKLTSGKNIINLADTFGLNEGKPFAYHYKLIEKNNRNNQFFRVDAGNVIDKTAETGKGYDLYNVVYAGASKVAKGGAMKLLLPDNYNVSWVYDEKNPTKIIPNKQENIQEAKKSIKSTVNKLGGSLAGVEKDLELGKFDNYSRIISTPIFTDDSLTAHSYWNKNCFQTSMSLGNINNYTSLQKKMFAKGINFVSDGAFVNEGLEGIHFKHILKWGEKSPYFYWFRVYALQDSPFTLGVFGKNMSDQKDNPNVAQRIVNAEKYYVEENGKIKTKKNPKYNPKKPTYIQVYDKRLIKDPSKLDPNKLIESYDKLSSDNIFEINNHNDTVIPYSFPIREETYHKNMEDLLNYNKNAKKPIKLNSFEATRILTKFENFEFEEKFESGIETWDANADIIKLNYAYSHTDTTHLKQSLTTEERNEMIKRLKKNNYEVQDYAITSGQYWTRKTNQILLMNAAQNIRKSELQENLGNSKDLDSKVDAYYKLIMENSNDKVFPKSLKEKINKEIIRNVLTGDYNLKTPKMNTDKTYKELITASLMDMPLDSVELGDDIAAVLGSPYITKRAETEDEIGMSRYEFIKKKAHLDKEYVDTFKRMNHIYNHEMTMFTSEILDAINLKLKALPEKTALKDESGNSTVLGKYLVPIITQEIAKFAVLKSILPDKDSKTTKVKMTVDDSGQIIYNYNDLKKTSLQEIGIIADSPKNEANQLLDRMEKNMSKFSDKDKIDLTNAIIKSIRGTNLESYKLAEMIIDRTQAGLDWRIDATKDIADINALKGGEDTFENTWDTVIEFWKKFNQNVMKENPNAYLAAEITDVYPIQVKTGSPYSDKFPNFKESERQILNKAGFTTMANYSYFFADIFKNFSKDTEKGEGNSIGEADRVYNILVGSFGSDKKEFLRSGSLPSIIYSYTVLGNHDVPRALHCLALDMGIFYANLKDKNNNYNREIAYKVLNSIHPDTKLNQPDLDSIDWGNVSNKAMAMGNSLGKGFSKSLSHLNRSRQEKQILDAIADISKGKFKGKHIEAEAFGVKPFDKTIEAVIEQAEYAHGLHLSKAEKKELFNETLKVILDPAYTKLLGIMKYLVALPGNPTLFAGDELGSTGYETKTKNIYLQNRSFLHHEWVDKNNAEEYQEFIAEKKHALDLLFEFRKRPEMHALNDGAPFTLNPMKGYIDNGGETKITGVLRQSTDGAMAISLLNPAGIKNDFAEYYTPSDVTVDRIELSKGSTNKMIGLEAGLKPGLIFANGYNKDDKYVVREYKGEYFLKKYNGPDPRNDGPIKFGDSTLILYHMPGMEQGKSEEYKPTFNGRRVMYNPQYNFVSNPYSQAQNIDLGSKLKITAK